MTAGRHTNQENEAPQENQAPREVPIDAGSPGSEPAAETRDEAILALEEENKRLEDQWLRARADLENFRKRVQRDQVEQERRAAERVLLELLQIQDGLDHALASEGEGAGAGEARDARFAAFYRGIELIHKQLADVLAREGVTPIDAKGIPFDPRWHEATARVDADGCPSDSVVEVIRKGYLLGDRLLRPARVTVAR